MNQVDDVPKKKRGRKSKNPPSDNPITEQKVPKKRGRKGSELTYHVIKGTPESEDTDDTDSYSKQGNTEEADGTRNIWKKIKDLTINLHTNNISDKRSACFWCTCEFDNPPIYIPKYELNIHKV